MWCTLPANLVVINKGLHYKQSNQSMALNWSDYFCLLPLEIPPYKFRSSAKSSKFTSKLKGSLKIRGPKLAWFSIFPASNRNRPTTINFFCIKNWIRIYFFMEYDWNTYLISIFSCCVVVWCVSKQCYMNIHERHFCILGWFPFLWFLDKFGELPLYIDWCNVSDLKPC